MPKRSDERQAAERTKLLREIARDLGAGVLATDLRGPIQEAICLTIPLDRRYTITSGVNAKGLRFVKSSFNPAPAPDPQSARAGEVCDLLGRLQEDAKHGDKAKAEDVAKLLTFADSLPKAPDGASKTVVQDSDVDKQLARTRAKTKWLAEAMTLVLERPHLSDAAIARIVGRNKAALCRSRTYKDAARSAREGLHIPKGSKEDGNIEAVWSK